MSNHLQAHIPRHLLNYVHFNEINKSPVNQVKITNIDKVSQLPKQHLLGMTNGIYDAQGQFHNEVSKYNNAKYNK